VPLSSSVASELHRWWQSSNSSLLDWLRSMNRSEEWRAFWNEMSTKATSDVSYNRLTGPREQEIERLSEEEVLEFIDPKPNEVILDAGCGTGTNILMLRSRVKQIFGIDYSKGAIDRCECRLSRENIRNVAVTHGSIANVPLATSSIDKVICMSVLHYMDNCEVRAAFNEFRRVLRNGGSLILHVKNLSSLYLSTLWTLKRIKLLLGRKTKFEYFRTFGWYVRLLRSFDFEIIDYSSLNLVVLDKLPDKLVLWVQRMELLYRRRMPWRLPFFRRHGADLKIRARLRTG
jgi:SAM-dependent methyltransferase